MSPYVCPWCSLNGHDRCSVHVHRVDAAGRVMRTLVCGCPCRGGAA